MKAKTTYETKVVSGRLLRPEEVIQDREPEPLPESSQYDHLFFQPYREIPKPTPINNRYWKKQDAMLYTKKLK